MEENLMQRKRKYLLTPKKELAERCLLIEQEIERLKEELTILVKDDERNQETIINLGKENEELYERVKGLEVASSKLDYESTIYANRIDKAIEYIKNHFLYHYGSEKRPIVFEDNYIQEIVDILRGEDDESN